MDLTDYQPIKETDETVSGGAEISHEPSEYDGKQKEKVTADLSEKKLSDGESVVKADGEEKSKDGGAEGRTTSVTLNAKRSCDEINDETGGSSATKKSKTASALVRRVGNTEGFSYEVVEEDEQVEPALQKLRDLGEGLPFLAVDLEGEKLTRKGELVILSLATEKHTYLFNIRKLGAGVFDKGLRDLLQDPDRQKLMFDCRQDSDCLWHQYKVKLTNVLDLQPMELVYKNDHTKHSKILNTKTNRASLFFPKVRGFKKCLQNYCFQEKDILQAKELGSQVMKPTGVWLEQPLQKVLLDYSAADVMGFFKLYEKLKSVLDSNNVAVVEASKNYLEFFRSRPSRTHDNFEGNGFVPWRIFPTTPSGTGPITTCQKCKRGFPRSDFEQSQLRRGQQMCLVCLKIQGEMNKGYY